MMKLSVANDFSDVPGPRLEAEGEHSAEVFRKERLSPLFLEAERQTCQLLVDLDGGFGYPTSFLEEAFGGLARELGIERVQKVLVVRSDEEPYLKQDVAAYIREAETGAQIA